jgi:hypothetical protein
MDGLFRGHRVRWTTWRKESTEMSKQTVLQDGLKLGRTGSLQESTLGLILWQAQRNLYLFLGVPHPTGKSVSYYGYGAKVRVYT